MVDITANLVEKAKCSATIILSAAQKNKYITNYTINSIQREIDTVRMR